MTLHQNSKFSSPQLHSTSKLEKDELQTSKHVSSAKRRGLEWVVTKSVGRKISKGGRALEKLRSRNSANKSSSTLSVAGYETQLAYAQGSPQGNAASNTRVKIENLFGETPIFGKMPTFLENFRSFS